MRFPKAVAALLMVFVCASCSASRPQRVLFVGNSLTYVGNLPAVFSALARANGHAVESWMVVSPGGTLTERVADGSAAAGLGHCRCSTMIIQERGGDLIDSFGQTADAQSRQAIASLAKLGKARGVRVVMLGTYNSRRVAHVLATQEANAARVAGIAYVGVVEKLWRLHDAYPSLHWLRDDGHPAKALTLLDAIALYKQLYGRYPASHALTVDAPIYGNHSGLSSKPRRAKARSPHADTPQQVTYSAAVVAKLVRAVQQGQGVDMSLRHVRG